jgi:hypothetical protein
VEYPAILNNCEACHVAGSYDFSVSTNANSCAEPPLDDCCQRHRADSCQRGCDRHRDPRPAPTGHRLLPPTALPYAFGSTFGYSFITNAATAAAATHPGEQPRHFGLRRCHDTCCHRPLQG